MIERHLQVAAVRRELDLAAIGVDGAPVDGVGDVIDRHVAHSRGRAVEVSGAQIELPLLHRVEYLLTQRERWLRAENRHLKNGEPVIRAGQDLIVEPEHHEGEDECPGQRRHEQLTHRHAARLERGDLVLRGQPAECVQYGDEHGHRQRHRDSEGNRQEKELGDHLPGEPLTDEIPELPSDVLEQHQRRKRRQRERERTKVLLEDVAADYFHDDSWGGPEELQYFYNVGRRSVAVSSIEIVRRGKVRGRTRRLRKKLASVTKPAAIRDVL